MYSWQLFNPVNITFGNGKRSDFIEKFEKLRLLVVTSERGRQQFSKDSILGTLRENIIWADKVSANPGLEETQNQINLLEGDSFDAVIAFGGGSAIDSAKAFAAALTPGSNTNDLKSLITQPKTFLKKGILPIYAIPTTSGTGSEVTPFATIWDHGKNKKLSLTHPNLFPSYAIVDPELTYKLPYLSTISTGLDALNQAFESIWNKNRTPISTFFASKAIFKALYALPLLHSSLQNHEARLFISEASLLAGLAISHTRTAICHSISYPLTAHYGLQHGIACAFTMSKVAEEVFQNAPEILDEVARLNGLKNAKFLLEQLNEVLKIIGLKKLIKEKLPNLDLVLKLRKEMITPGRSDNFILPIDNDRLGKILSASMLDL